MFDTVLFDLDGTLTDPFEGISNSIIYALKKFGIAAPGKTLLKKFIGPPLTESFSKYCGLSCSDALRAVEYYREYFAATGIFENKPYTGVQELLSELKKKRVYSRSGDVQARTICKSYCTAFRIRTIFQRNLRRYHGSEQDTKGRCDCLCLKKCEIKDKKRAVMVGDREHDIIGAKTNGLSSIGVLYGYGSKEELLEAGANYIANSPVDILHYILG